MKAICWDCTSVYFNLQKLFNTIYFIKHPLSAEICKYGRCTAVSELSGSLLMGLDPSDGSILLKLKDMVTVEWNIHFDRNLKQKSKNMEIPIAPTAVSHRVWNYRSQLMQTPINTWWLPIKICLLACLHSVLHNIQNWYLFKWVIFAKSLIISHSGVVGDLETITNIFLAIQEGYLFCFLLLISFK